MMSSTSYSMARRKSKHRQNSSSGYTLGGLAKSPFSKNQTGFPRTAATTAVAKLY